MAPSSQGLTAGEILRASDALAPLQIRPPAPSRRPMAKTTGVPRFPCIQHRRASRRASSLHCQPHDGRPAGLLCFANGPCPRPRPSRSRSRVGLPSPQSRQACILLLTDLGQAHVPVTFRSCEDVVHLLHGFDLLPSRIPGAGTGKAML